MTAVDSVPDCQQSPDGSAPCQLPDNDGATPDRDYAHGAARASAVDLSPAYCSNPETRKRLTASWGYDEWSTAFDDLLEDYLEQTDPRFLCPPGSIARYVLGCLIGVVFTFVYIKGDRSFLIPMSMQPVTGEAASLVWCALQILSCVAGLVLSIYRQSEVGLLDGLLATHFASLCYVSTFFTLIKGGKAALALAAVFFVGSVCSAIMRTRKNQSLLALQRAAQACENGTLRTTVILSIFLFVSITGLAAETYAHVDLSQLTDKKTAMEQVAQFMRSEKDASTQEIVDMMQVAVWAESQEFGIAELGVPRVSAAVLPENVTAQYLWFADTIIFNSLYLDRADREYLVMVAAHETAHAWQHHVLEDEVALTDCAYGRTIGEDAAEEWRRGLPVYPLLQLFGSSHDAVRMEHHAYLYEMLRIEDYETLADS